MSREDRTVRMLIELLRSIGRACEVEENAVDPRAAVCRFSDSLHLIYIDDIFRIFEENYVLTPREVR